VAEHKDILNKELREDDSVVFCGVRGTNRMTVGRVLRVLPETVEVVYETYNRGGRVVTSIFRKPEDVVRV